jgi:hypothetical protein
LFPLAASAGETALLRREPLPFPVEFLLLPRFMLLAQWGCTKKQLQTIVRGQVMLSVACVQMTSREEDTCQEGAASDTVRTEQKVSTGFTFFAPAPEIESAFFYPRHRAKASCVLSLLGTRIKNIEVMCGLRHYVHAESLVSPCYF